MILILNEKQIQTHTNKHIPNAVTVIFALKLYKIKMNRLTSGA